MKKLLLKLMLTFSAMFVAGCASENFGVGGNLDYSRSVSSPQETLRKTVELKYRQNLHETPDKKYLFYIGGKVFLDHDVFRNTSKVNTMTSLGVDF